VASRRRLVHVRRAQGRSSTRRRRRHRRLEIPRRSSTGRHRRPLTRERGARRLRAALVSPCSGSRLSREFDLNPYFILSGARQSMLRLATRMRPRLHACTHARRAAALAPADRRRPRPGLHARRRGMSLAGAQPPTARSRPTQPPTARSRPTQPPTARSRPTQPAATLTDAAAATDAALTPADRRSRGLDAS
jgi:hypothetical protein